eukprot:TRINITY_DN1494_c0_g2_i3.p1 TRINITY_DN1494_c0_g2~~TRINITY_DN1494_c0_g2_i3.p1  ORF type:complete len:116 (-),score=34.84 TRINITY_DN1494_c0_g2_i3:140-487(-)
MDYKDKKGEGEVERLKVRITLTSKIVASVERACREMVSNAKGRQAKVRGPVRIPTKVLRHTVLKTPCGEGTNTYDRFELRIFKRVIDIECLRDEIKEITTMKLDPGVDVELTVES